MNILLTGAAGFIGSHVAEQLLARGYSVVGLDNFDPFYARAIKEDNLGSLRGAQRFTFLEADFCVPADLARVFALPGRPVDLVVHLGALAGVRESMAHPERFFEVNVMGTLRLVEAARRAGVTRFVYASSSSVYGQDSPLPFREDAACARPVSPYAASKRAAELQLATEHHLYQMAVTILRFFTAYGPRQRPDLAIHKFTRLIEAGQPIELWGDGSTERDYTYIDDIAAGVVAAVAQQLGDPLARQRVYNLGGSASVSLSRLVQALGEALGKTPAIAWRPERPEEMRRTLADTTSARAELGFAPRVSLTEGLRAFVLWWRQHAR
jgi:UDP-glucuronate 4-epimerase